MQKNNSKPISNLMLYPISLLFIDMTDLVHSHPRYHAFFRTHVCRLAPKLKLTVRLPAQKSSEKRPAHLQKNPHQHCQLVTGKN